MPGVCLTGTCNDSFTHQFSNNHHAIWREWKKGKHNDTQGWRWDIGTGGGGTWLLRAIYWTHGWIWRHVVLLCVCVCVILLSLYTWLVFEYLSVLMVPGLFQSHMHEPRLPELSVLRPWRKDGKELNNLQKKREMYCVIVLSQYVGITRALHSSFHGSCQARWAHRGESNCEDLSPRLSPCILNLSSVIKLNII